MAQQGCKLYVGNLPWSMGDKDLAEEFAAHGKVVAASIVIDKETKKSRGFGFVEMATAKEADAAIDATNGTTVGGRVLTVNIARERARG